MSPGIVIGILALAVALSLGGLWLARRVEGGWWRDPGRASGVLGASRGPFAVILAFVIFVAFQGYTASRDAALREASAVRRLFKEADLLTPIARAQIQANLVCYARGVISLDWPAMEGGRSSPVVDNNAALIDDQLTAIQQNGAHGAVLDAIFADAATRDDGRADRVNDGRTEIPGPVWIVLILGALSVLTYVVLFADPAERFISQAVMVGSVTIVIVGGLLLIYFLSHPFLHQMGSIRPTAMERTLRELQTDPAFARETSLPVICDAQGRPLASTTS